MSHHSGTATALLPRADGFQEEGSVSLNSSETTANYMLRMSKLYHVSNI